jgi:hypothetical protein
MLMIANQCVDLHVALPEATLTCYPANPNRFSRKVNVQEWFSPEAYARIRPVDLFLTEEMAALSVFRDVPEDQRHDFFLPRILWEG